MRAIIARGGDVGQLRESHQQQGGSLLLEEGIRLAEAGRTSLDEVLRVTTPSNHDLQVQAKKRTGESNQRQVGRSRIDLHRASATACSRSVRIADRARTIFQQEHQDHQCTNAQTLGGAV